MLQAGSTDHLRIPLEHRGHASRKSRLLELGIARPRENHESALALEEERPRPTQELGGISAWHLPHDAVEKWSGAATGEEQLPVFRVNHPARALGPQYVDVHEVAVDELERRFFHRS